MAIKIKNKPNTAAASVSVETKDHGNTVTESAHEEQAPLPPTLTGAPAASAPWCEVGFDCSFTKNLGNYQSAKVSVHLNIPCMHAEINDAFEFAKVWVNERMETIIEELGGA